MAIWRAPQFLACHSGPLMSGPQLTFLPGLHRSSYAHTHVHTHSHAHTLSHTHSHPEKARSGQVSAWATPALGGPCSQQVSGPRCRGLWSESRPSTRQGAGTCTAGTTGCLVPTADHEAAARDRALPGAACGVLRRGAHPGRRVRPPPSHSCRHGVEVG